MSSNTSQATRASVVASDVGPDRTSTPQNTVSVEEHTMAPAPVAAAAAVPVAGPSNSTQTAAIDTSDAAVKQSAMEARSALQSNSDLKGDKDLFHVEFSSPSGGPRVTATAHSGPVDLPSADVAAAMTDPTNDLDEDLLNTIIHIPYVGNVSHSLKIPVGSATEISQNMGRMHRVGQIFATSFKQSEFPGGKAADSRNWRIKWRFKGIDACLKAYEKASWSPSLTTRTSLLTCTLPEPDGEVESNNVFFAPGDEELSDSLKLRVPKLITSMSPQVAAFAIAATTGNYYRETPPVVASKRDVIVAAYGVAAAGLLAMYGKEINGRRMWFPDGDWILVDDVPNVQEMRNAEETIAANLSKARDAATLAIATKIQWWNTRYHTGTKYSQNSGIAYQALKKLPDAKDYKIDDVRMIGHWASTLLVLKMLKKNVRPVCRINIPVVYTQIMNEVYIKADHLPVGCKKLEWCASAFDILIDSSIAENLPLSALNSILNTFMKVKRIKAKDTRFHIDANYLTGTDKEPYNDDFAPGGLAIPFVYHVKPHSSLAHAQYFKVNKDRNHTSLKGFIPLADSIFREFKDRSANGEFGTHVEKPVAKVNMGSGEHKEEIVMIRALKNMEYIDAIKALKEYNEKFAQKRITEAREETSKRQGTK